MLRYQFVKVCKYDYRTMCIIIVCPMQYIGTERVCVCVLKFNGVQSLLLKISQFE